MINPRPIANFFAKSSFQGLTTALNHGMISHVVKRHGAMAQSVEHIVHIDGVVGSSPTGTTTEKTTPSGWFFSLLSAGRTTMFQEIGMHIT